MNSEKEILAFWEKALKEYSDSGQFENDLKRLVALQSGRGWCPVCNTICERTIDGDAWHPDNGCPTLIVGDVMET